MGTQQYSKAKQACPARARGSRRGSPKQVYYYTLLIKYNGRKISDEDDYVKVDSALEFLRKTKKLNIEEVKIEKGKYRYHVHALLLSHKKNIYVKQYQIAGYYIGIQKRRSESKYRSYIMKEQELIEYYSNHYAFDVEDKESESSP